MKMKELFDRGEFVVSAEVGPPKGIHVDELVEEGGCHDQVWQINNCFEEALSLKPELGLENQAARSRETRICGINPITHMIIVFLK